jgi:hypothetical protein
MESHNEECRWCGSPSIYQLGLCYLCFLERQLAELEGKLTPVG